MTRIAATFLLGAFALTGVLAAPAPFCGKASVCQKLSKMGTNIDPKSPWAKVIADSGMSAEEFIAKNCNHDGLQSLFPSVSFPSSGGGGGEAPVTSSQAEAPAPATTQQEEQPAPTPSKPAEQPAPTPTKPAEQQPAPTTTKKEEQPAPSPTTKAAPSPTSGGGGGGSADQQQYLQIHNDLRAKHGADALTWDDGLAAKAQAWADQCTFEHSGSGENLAAGTGDYSIADALGSWAAEESQYNAASNSGAGHYTQMIWKGTSKVGCAMATSCSGIFDASFGPAKYVVCEYNPAGNVVGQHDQNIQ